MTHIFLTATFKSFHGNEEKVLALLQEAQVETRKEKGCIKYDLIRDFEDSTIFVSL